MACLLTPRRRAASACEIQSESFITNNWLTNAINCVYFNSLIVSLD